MLKVSNNYIVNGQELSVGDMAYNKNKREQVENPHTIAMIVAIESKNYIVLQAPNTDEFIPEEAEEVEKYPGDKDYNTNNNKQVYPKAKYQH